MEAQRDLRRSGSLMEIGHSSSTQTRRSSPFISRADIVVFSIRLISIAPIRFDLQTFRITRIKRALSGPLDSRSKFFRKTLQARWWRASSFQLAHLVVRHWHDPAKLFQLVGDLLRRRAQSLGVQLDIARRHVAALA